VLIAVTLKKLSALAFVIIGVVKVHPEQRCLFEGRLIASNKECKETKREIEYG